jgi:ssDNA-binding Zn-finger/Zn-ribbon topoisomerase 1
MIESKQYQEKDKCMKTNQIPKLFATAIAAFALAGAANAQYKAVGDDGIAASPKVRQALNAQAASANIATARVAAMACPKCKDISATEPNRQAKGGQILMGTATKVVTKHTCGDCDTRLDVVGTGKAKTTVATHTCAAAVANNLTCCATAMAK